MKNKIVGVTVGTSISPQKVYEKMNVDAAIEDALMQAKESGQFEGPQGPQGPEGPQGPQGSDAEVTSDKIIEALGYVPADESEQSGGLTETGVEPGTYGGFDTENSVYNIPNVTVDEYGRVTDASSSVLPKASAENDGYISAEDYVKLKKIPCLPQNANGVTIFAGKTEMHAAYYIYGTDAVTDVPIVNAIGLYNDGTYVQVVPLTCKLHGSYSSKTLTYTWFVDISIPEALEYDLDCYLWSNYQPYRFAM